MNDRYLYRAKRTDNGEWVEGHLVYDNFDHEYRIVIALDYSTGTCFHTMMAPRVDQSTICQCTGIKDKNGKLIWENDILVGHLYCEDDATYARVLWHENGFCTQENYYDDCEQIDEFCQNYFEVCGNVFDNPELL